MQLRPDDLDPWFYPVTIKGRDVPCGVYPAGEPNDRAGWELVVRQNLRRMILVGEVVKRVDFKGMEILDVACNCAFWSAQYIKGYGASHVTGIEGRQKFVEQARMLYKDMGINKQSVFHQGDVTNLEWYRGMKPDFILCAGLLYHLKEPEQFLREMCIMQPKHILVDTRVLPMARQHKERSNLHFNSIDGNKDVKVTTQTALEMVMIQAGYSVEMLPVPFKTVKGIDGGDDYNNGRRVALLATKEK